MARDKYGFMENGYLSRPLMMLLAILAVIGTIFLIIVIILGALYGEIHRTGTDTGSVMSAVMEHHPLLPYANGGCFDKDTGFFLLPPDEYKGYERNDGAAPLKVYHHIGLVEVRTMNNTGGDHKLYLLGDSSLLHEDKDAVFTVTIEPGYWFSFLSINGDGFSAFSVLDMSSGIVTDKELVGSFKTGDDGAFAYIAPSLSSFCHL